MIQWHRGPRTSLTYSHDAAEVTANVTALSSGMYAWGVTQFGRTLAVGQTVTRANARAQANQWIATAVEAATGELV